MPEPTAAQAVEPHDQPTQPDHTHNAGGPVLERVGDYDLLYELGRGGMGVVFKARDVKLDRFVALKMILPAAMPDESDLARFHTEASAAAGLQHPNIVAVHAVGQEDGRCYYCMELIEGPSLAKKLAGGPLPGRTAARYMVGVARGIDHAHRHGVLHRDLKPANILIDPDDHPHVADFGLAKQLARDSHGCTRTGAVLGTPSYMSPEQAAGAKTVGPASDIYGLGALLYELLTGRPPFKAESSLDTIMQVLERDPAPPRLLNPKVDRDLETICLKCLQKDPARRYPSAAMVAEDLERFLNGESIRARSFNMIDRIARMLEHSQYDVQFGSYGTMLYWFAAILVVTQLTKQVLVWTQQPVGWLIACQGAQFGLIGVACCAYRGGVKGLWPTTTAERQLWTVWIGYILAILLIVVAGWRDAGLYGIPPTVVYPFYAVTAGMAFFFLGSCYWGWCYAFGLAFFGLGAAMLFTLDWAMLEFGALWALCLVILGARLRWLARQRADGGKAPAI
jgi:serine/threonine-protein kinase